MQDRLGKLEKSSTAANFYGSTQLQGYLKCKTHCNNPQKT